MSQDGLHWELELRQGIKFSDGHPFDADDVVFTFQAILDEQVHSAQRALLMLEGKPIVVRKLDTYRVAFDLPQPYSVPDRLFDGIFILPRHKLEAAWKQGKLADAWRLSTPPSEIAGLGPFRLKEYVAGQHITLERNPYYWKVDQAGAQLPYLTELEFVFAGSEDNQVLRFQAGESDIISRVGARNFAVLEKDRERRGYELVNAGSGLEYNFLFFNLGDLPAGALAGNRRPPGLSAPQEFPAGGFRRHRPRCHRPPGVSGARRAAGRPGTARQQGVDQSPACRRRCARWNARANCWPPTASNGAATARCSIPQGQPVEFSILTSNSNPERLQMATHDPG